MTSLNEISRLVVEAGRKGGIPDSYLRIAPASAENGTPHVEVKGETFAYVVSERGCELSRQETTSLDSLLYLIMSDIVEKYAFATECTQREQGKDPRRAAFGMWLAIMSAINGEWGVRLAHELDAILARAPYVDH
jgi:Immunity protein 63